MYSTTDPGLPFGVNFDFTKGSNCINTKQYRCSNFWYLNGDLERSMQDVKKTYKDIFYYTQQYDIRTIN